MFELFTHADGQAGTSVVELDIDYCQIVSTSPCQVQCFEMRLRWRDLPWAVIYGTFISPPPTSQAPEPLPPTCGGGPGSYSVGFVQGSSEDCHVIQYVVPPWGGGMSGERFAELFQDHVQELLAELNARLWHKGIQFDPDCTTFSAY